MDIDPDSDSEIASTLKEVVELGYVHIRDGRIATFQKPIENICVTTYDRWSTTMKYLGDYAYCHPDFGGEFFVCLYDGWREYSAPAPEPDSSARRFVPWRDLDTDTRAHFLGQGNANEPRFRHSHPDTTLYPELPLQVLTYNRHVGDTNALLIPDPEFITSQFNHYTQTVQTYDTHWHRKAPKMIWRGSPNLSAAYSPRSTVLRLGQQTPFILDASYKSTPISWMLRHKYLLDVDGMVSAWSGLYWKMRSNSLVIKTPSHWEQWWYPMLKPYENYVPLESFTVDAVRKAYEWCQLNDTECQRIVKNAQDTIAKLTYDYAIRDYNILST